MSAKARVVRKIPDEETDKEADVQSECKRRASVITSADKVRPSGDYYSKVKPNSEGSTAKGSNNDDVRCNACYKPRGKGYDVPMRALKREKVRKESTAPMARFAGKLHIASAQDKKHAVIHMTWKLELIERQKVFMQSLRKEQEAELKIAETEMEFFRQLAIFAEELDDLDVADAQYRQFSAQGRKCVAPFANSSDMELSPNELEADDDSYSSGSHSDGGSDDLIYGANE
ncbi:hypothetical protein DFJ58DRAFT_842928 [Suillus subalutaceus]|uniref:uncharacterized protein n=1 Tax=Suillus subalutaceus TaxID=48586 RepID=UPI001B87DE26|nr:uncharacterized protein DFJ58DRAFT_842928 [Suillus subalutaceus]KAG1848552.1 hypothetical protein DFJ58DRAFT_842928 [Suillus subalutaceus]